MMDSKFMIQCIGRFRVGFMGSFIFQLLHIRSAWCALGQILGLGCDRSHILAWSDWQHSLQTRNQQAGIDTSPTILRCFIHFTVPLYTFDFRCFGALVSRAFSCWKPSFSLRCNSGLRHRDRSKSSIHLGSWNHSFQAGVWRLDLCRHCPWLGIYSSDRPRNDILLKFVFL